MGGYPGLYNHLLGGARTVMNMKRQKMSRMQFLWLRWLTRRCPCYIKLVAGKQLVPLLLLLLMLPAVVQAQFDFAIITGGTVTITKYTGSGGDVVIPATINGYPVTSIGGYYNQLAEHEYGAFEDCTTLTSVTIGTNVTSIGDSAFYDCPGLTSVTIPNSVTSIGGYAFFWCTSLNNVTMGSGVTSIGDHAFLSCWSLTSITIPSSVTSIGNEAFDECGLTSITIPDSVTGIPDRAFAYCGGLTNITIGKGVTSIGDLAFANSGLTSVTIPNSVTSIGDELFSGCPLTSVTIPDSVTNIGQLAFYDCLGLTSIGVSSNNPVYCSVNGVLFNRNQTTLIEYPEGIAGGYTIPNSVTDIGGSAFASCSRLTSVTVPNSVTNIGDSAFADCLSLTNITIPNSVTSIGDGAFGGCTNVTSVCFQGNAPNLGMDVFDEYEILGWPPGFTLVFDPATVYYLPGTTGWSNTFAGLPTALWTLPQPLVLQGSVGVHSNQFGFTVSWATNLSVVVESSTDLAAKTWTPMQTNALNNGVVNFSDPQWTNYPSRFYRVRSQ
jgi:hypothetical protein